MEKAKEAAAVRWWDPRNFQNIGEYLSLALPSLLFISAMYSLYDIETVISGWISLEDQAS